MAVFNLKKSILALKIKERLLALKSPSEIFRVWFHKDVASTEKICTTCSNIGVPAEEMPGSREIELTLYAIFASIALLFLLILILGEIVNNLQVLRFIHGFHRVLKRVGELFAFLSLVYTIYRISSQREHCPKCHGSTVIPLDSPRAKELLKGH